MPTLYLQCNMDRLGPAYENGKPYYLLTLSVAFADVPATADEVRNTLRPWAWTSIAGLSVYKQPAAGGAFTKVDHDVVPVATLAGRANLIAALDQELEAQLKDFGATAPDFAWDPIKPKQTAWNGRTGRDWRSWVGHIGSYPGGIGSALNLAFVFVPHTAPELDDIVLAAPHVVLSNVELKPGDPATNLKPITGLPGAFEWKYEGSDVKAVLNKLEPPKADVDTYINIETLWRNKLPLDGGGNWTEQLDDRLAQAFDGPERLLGWVRRRAAGKPIPADFNDLLTAALYRVVSAALDSSLRPPHADAISLLPAKVDSSLPPIPLGTPIPASFLSIVKDAIIKAGANFPATAFPPPPDNGETFHDNWSVVQESFRQNEVLMNIVLQLWKGFFGAKWTEELEKALTERLQQLTQLHQHLLSHSTGNTWRALVPEGVKAGEELNTATLRVRDDLRAFGKLTWPAGDADWNALIDEQVDKVMLPPRDIAADCTSDGLLIQVDKIEAPATNPTRDKQDYLRRITGVGIMLQHKGGPWRCLNMADVKVLLEPDAEGMPVDTTPKAVPYRFAYAAGIRQGFVKYLNQPLVAKSPWSSLAPSRKLEPGRDNGNAAEAGFLRYDSPYQRKQPGETEWLLERLVYGEDYVAAPFYFGNAGILPAELAASDGGSHRIPWSFKLPDATVQLPAATQLTYRRSCHVGLLRINEAVSFPPAVPEHVYPIASVLEKEPEERHPLIILTPSNQRGWQSGRQSFSFSVRPPSLDVKVWDRWIPESDQNRDHRKGVLGQLHDLRFRLDAGLSGKADTTVDDPAVTGFEIKAERLWPTAQSFTATTNPVFKPKKDPADRLSVEQKEGIAIKVMSAAIAAPTVEVVNDVFVLKIPDGEVWQVNLQPTIPPESRKRFVTEVVNQTEPLSFVVEVAQPLVNSEAAARQLYDSLKLERPAGKNQLNVKLDPAGFLAFAPLVHRVELVTQRWRWDGRPVYELPLTDPPQSGLPFEKVGELDEFEGDGLLFSSREDSDASILPTQVEFAAKPQPVTLREIDWTGKDGVLYYRLAVRVFSRYEGLLAEAVPVESSGVSGLRQPRRWKRYVRESVWGKRVPKPSVKLVLPLTESITNLAGTKGAAGWLVWLDEQWYGEAMGGLGEGLRSEIIEVRLPDSLDEVRKQFGPDAIIELPDDPFATHEIELPKPVGAIGSTFDTIAEAPLFAHSVFFQPPPVVKQEGQEQALDLSFYFVKVRFQRVIAGADPSKPRGADKELASDLTDGYWTQILPPAEWWFVQEAKARVHISELTFSMGNGFVWQGRPATILPTGPQPQPADSVCRFQLFGLVTQRVTDAFGRKEQERFAKLCSLQKLATSDLTPRNKLRLIEVQFRLKANEPLPVADTEQALSELVKALFPNGDTPEDAKGRIIRVSSPLVLL